MNFGYSITISFIMWILGTVLIVAIFLPDIQTSINAVNKINQEVIISSQNTNIDKSTDTTNLINYTPLSILSGRK